MCETEVGEENPTSACYEEILRLDVAMDEFLVAHVTVGKELSGRHESAYCPIRRGSKGRTISAHINLFSSLLMGRPAYFASYNRFLRFPVHASYKYSDQHLVRRW